jgi:hypothetical protein
VEHFVHYLIGHVDLRLPIMIDPKLVQ